MPCSGTAACTLRLTTCASAGQCCGGLKPLLGSVPLILVVETLAGWPRVSYTFMCSLLPCLAALWLAREQEVSRSASEQLYCFPRLFNARLNRSGVKRKGFETTYL